MKWKDKLRGGGCMHGLGQKRSLLKHLSMVTVTQDDI